MSLLMRKPGGVFVEIIPAILAGGSGTRLWPLSRKAYPKQFLDLLGEHSLFQQTCLRIQAPQFARPIVLCNAEHRFIVAEQMRQIGCRPQEIVLEPVGRNTAPAALIASLLATRQAEDSMVLLLPSDHVIADREAFLHGVVDGIDAASRGQIVTFGVRPDHAHTGYGYIEVAAAGEAALKVRRFVEKPSRDLAEQYLQSGRHYWNAGIFLFSAQAMIESFRRHAPELMAPCREALDKAGRDLDFLRLEEASYARCKSISIDYAIMEKADNIACIPLRTKWSDLGSWTAVAEHFPADGNGNAAHGRALFARSRDCFVYAHDESHVVVNGLTDIIVVATRDALLVTSKADAQNVGAIVEELARANDQTVIHHVRVHRPWGWFEGLRKGKRFQVKCLMVKPGEKLSLQSHRFRAEHWVVVQGRVRVTVDEETLLLGVNDSVYIPLGARHRLENVGKEPALLIEVQVGDYLGEDDIIRHDDIYNRSKNGT